MGRERPTEGLGLAQVARLPEEAWDTVRRGRGLFLSWMFCGWTKRWPVLRKTQLSPEALRQSWERGAVTSASAPWVCRSSSGLWAGVNAVVLIQLPISAPGLTPPPGAHWPAPHPQPARSGGGGRWWSVASLSPGPGCAAEAAPLPQDRAGRAARGGRKQTRGSWLPSPAVTGGCSGPAWSPCAHTHTPRRRDTQTQLPAATRTQRPGSARAPRLTRSSQRSSRHRFAGCAPSCTFGPGAPQPARPCDQQVRSIPGLSLRPAAHAQLQTLLWWGPLDPSSSPEVSGSHMLRRPRAGEG